MQKRGSPVHAGLTVAELVVRALSQPAQQVAMTSGEEQMTYGELRDKCWQVVRALQQAGLSRGDTAALLFGNRLEAVVAILAVQLLGLKYLSLHPLASLADHRFVLEDAGVKALLVDNSRYAERATELASSVSLVLSLYDTPEAPGLISASASCETGPMPVSDNPQEVFRLAYTGGTTGRSKGIRHTHRTTVTMIMQMLATYEWPLPPRYLVTTPISHAAGSLLLPTFLKGGTVVLMEKFSTADFCRLVEQHRINLTFLVPTQIYGLLEEPAVKQRDLSSLELVLYGAAPIAPAKLAQAIEAIGPVFGQLYGQAEAPMTIAYLPKKEHDLKRPHLLASCGKVVVGTRVGLFDSQMQPVLVGEVGEICVRGPLVMEGYLNRPEETEKVFAGGWLHTGDMARMDEDGYLYLVDRAKDMIISGGFNVYPSEVEACLAQHPQVAMCAVIGVPDEKWGERVTAVVVLKDGETCAEPALIEYVMQRKGPVETPKQVVFTDELPLTALGKIDKKTLRKQFWDNTIRQI
ncbi:AMP-binding protein [Achromobacter sp. F4_2707]|uniref:AMP-binding protein n=1 Tax=Achromobacter sp. F4_2707 TaxID=3114286 RepID=UPI0039C5F6D0